MGGKKKKIDIKKIENKDSRSVTFSKRRSGLYSMASKLCLLSGAKMAILATPLSSESHASFFSFGHSSVDSVVSAFLTNQRPREETTEENDIKGLGFWWEDESLAQSDDPEKLRAAIDSISKMLNDLNKLRSEAVENREKLKKKRKEKMKKDISLQELDKTLIAGSTSANLEGFNKNNKEDDQTVAIFDKNGLPENFDGCDQKKQDLEVLSMQSEMDHLRKNSVDDLHRTYQEEMYQNKALDPQSTSYSSSLCIQDDQILTLSDYNENDSLLGNLDGRNLKQELEAFSKQVEMDFEMDDVSMVTMTNQSNSSDSEIVQDLALMIKRDLSGEEFDLDQYIDLDTNFTSLLMDNDVSNQNMCSDSENTGAMVVNNKDLDEDNLKFFDYFNNLPSITTLWE